MRLNLVMILQHPFKVVVLLFCHNNSTIICDADHVFHLSRKPEIGRAHV